VQHSRNLRDEDFPDGNSSSMELARRTVAVNFNTGGTLKEKQFQAKVQS